MDSKDSRKQKNLALLLLLLALVIILYCTTIIRLGHFA